jgi:predicted KAP-like P-loop ATPase
MWTDNETALDYLNFSGVAETVAELVVQANARPISIGVAGAWGVGKSSMIKLVQAELEKRQSDKNRFVFVTFNAWLYQGYDDARASLMDVIGDTLQREAKARQTGVEKTKEFLKRVRWTRVVKFAASVAATAAGFPPIALAATALDTATKVLAGEDATTGAETLEDAAHKITEGGAGFVDPKTEYSPPREIDALRASFAEALNELGVTLVVLIDDLDRCLPETTISTLEAIRLFLFLPRTAFVIAADDQMIKHAVKRHFVGLDDELVTNYFDKLIQIPIRVPTLGIQDVRAYMMLLYVENSTLGAELKEKIRTATIKQLRQSWQGKRVDLAFIQTLGIALPPELISRLNSADRLAVIMASATRIQGNPRLIKRFLNTLAIRLTVARTNGVTIDEAVLTKMLLLERCAPAKAFSDIASEVTKSADGRAELLRLHEEAAANGKTADLSPPWNEPFIADWLSLSPVLADQDLRGVLYVSREHAPLISPEDRLSSEAALLLTALLDQPDMAATLKSKLAQLPSRELATIMQRLLLRASKEQQWGAPKILTACLAVADADVSQAAILAAFLSELPPTQIQPSIVPKISGRTWATSVYDRWKKSPDVSGPVKSAIGQEKK